MICPFFLTTLMTSMVLGCHHGYYNYNRRSRARAAQLRRNVAPNNLTNSELQEMKDYDFCEGHHFMPYSSIELRATAVLQDFQSHPDLAVADGGRLTCSFDNPKEFCSWHNAGDGALRFYRAHHEVPFDSLRFECTTNSMFEFEGGFLLAGGEATMLDGKAAIETEIQCLYDDSHLKLDIWTNSPQMTGRVCLMQMIGAMQCQEIMTSSSPVNVSIPQSVDPFKIRVEFDNLGIDSLVLIDNIYFEGRICELVSEEENKVEETLEPLPTRTTEPIPETLPIVVPPSRRIMIPLELPRFETTTEELTTTEEVTTTTMTSSPESTDELTACEALTCNFNEEHSCFYGLSGIGSTSPWLSGHKLVGNRHTGIQRLNLNDPSAVGFVYVGEDKNGKKDSETFVMESPKFNLNTNIFLVFDVYVRSKYPILKICLDSFDYCPYKSPEVAAKFFWRTNEKLFVPPGIRKIYFLVENVIGNQFLALDNIRVEAEDGSDICGSDIL